jgi:DNA-binding NarL/FixJ family response regulator
VILPKDRDPRLITVRRGGTLQDSDHRFLAEWAAKCAEHVLHLFEAAQPADARPRQAIELARAWVRGEITMSQARTAAGHAQAAARDLSGAARHAAYAAGQAAAVAHAISQLPTPGFVLTERKRAVLALMVEMLNNTQIAARLTVSPFNVH